MQTEEEKISRIAEKVALRIVKIYGNGGGGTSSAIESWVSENFLSIEFFSNLFKAYGPAETEGDPDIEILPNDTQSTISNIKAMFGFWTEQYVSALGQNPDGGGGSVVLNACLSSINASALGVPTGVNTGLIFNGNTWVYREMNDINMSAVWQALGASTSEQINISHLTDALVNYATASDVGTLQGYFTNGQANSALEADTLATARTIWGQSFDGSANITGNMTGVTNIDALLYFDTTNSRIGVIQQSPAYTLDVTGTMRLTGAATFGSTMTVTGLITANGGITIPSGQSLTIGDAVITWDATAHGIKITKGLYSETFISALGAGSTGSGGVDMTTVWQALAASTSEQINASHLTGALSTYATQSYVATYVTNNIALHNLSDVDVSGVTSGQYLKFNGQKWVPSTISGTGSVNSITIGSGGTNYTPDASGIVTLPAYPSLTGYATETWVGNNYLPLTGGTITSTKVDPLVLISTHSANASYITFKKSSVMAWTGYDSTFKAFLQSAVASNYGALCIKDDGIPYFGEIVNGAFHSYMLWHEGNDGAGSGLDADLLDGHHGSYYATADDYLPLSAGSNKKLTKALYFYYANSNMSGDIGFDSTGFFMENLSYNNWIRLENGKFTYMGYEIWNANNDGSGSGLDADLLDGHHGSYFATASSLDNYLPLSGGIMTGTIKYRGENIELIRTGGNDTTWRGGICYSWENNTTIALWCKHTNGQFIWNAGTDFSSSPGSADGSTTLTYDFQIGRLSNALYVRTQGRVIANGYGLFGGSNGIYIGSKYNGSNADYDVIERAVSNGGLYINYYTTGPLSLCYGGGNVGVGVNNPSYKLHVSGDIYATGGVTCLSDARKKDVVCELPMTVEDVAGAPAVRFLWKDNRVAGNQAGTLAQYWQRVLPEVITDKSGELSMQYGVAALVAAIVTARKVVDHERRIRELESENMRLRNEVEQLKTA